MVSDVSGCTKPGTIERHGYWNRDGRDQWTDEKVNEYCTKDEVCKRSRQTSRSTEQRSEGYPQTDKFIMK